MKLKTILFKITQLEIFFILFVIGTNYSWFEYILFYIFSKIVYKLLEIFLKRRNSKKND